MDDENITKRTLLDELKEVLELQYNLKELKNGGNNMIEKEKVYARIPSYSNGDGYCRIFTGKEDNFKIDDKAVPLLDGSRSFQLKNKEITIRNGDQILTINIPKMLIQSEAIVWIWTSQPRYKIGDDIKGFVVARERLNPHVMALRTSTIKNGLIQLVSKDNGEVKKAIPIDLRKIVTQFTLSMEDKKYMDDGKFDIVILDEGGKEIGRKEIEIGHFEKKELIVRVEKPNYIMVGETLTMSINGKLYSGDTVKKGIVSVIGRGVNLTKEFDGKESVTFEINDLEEGEHSFDIFFEDSNGRQETVKDSITVTSEPVNVIVSFPEEKHYSTLPLDVHVKIETPDKLPISFLPVTIKWKRLGTLAEEKITEKRKTMESDIGGYLEFKETFENEGTYQLSIECSVKGEVITVTKSINVNRFTQGDMFIKNKIKKQKYNNGEKIKGEVKIYSHPDSIKKATHGYLDLITDKIVETRRVEIINGKVEYEFNGVMDFWGNVSVDFYINVNHLAIIINDMDKIDKSGCIHSTAKTLVESKIPLELKVNIDSVESAPTGQEINISVSIDGELLRDDIHVFGALVDKRIITFHDSNTIGKTFLKPPPCLKIMLKESKRMYIPPPPSYISYRGGGGRSFGRIGSSMQAGMPKWEMSARKSTSHSTSEIKGIPKKASFTSYAKEEIRSSFSYDVGVNSYTDSLIGSDDDDEIDAMYGLFGLNSFDEETLPEFIFREDFSESVLIEPFKLSKCKGKLTLKLPDAVTTYDIMLFAVGKNQFGIGKKEIVVKNPIFTHVLNPASMIMESDKILLQAIIQNSTLEDIENVGLRMHGLERLKLVDNDPIRKIPLLPAGKSTSVGWDIIGTEVGNANILLDLITKKFVERTKLDQKLFIKPPGEPIIETMQSYLDANQQVMLKWEVNGNEAFNLGVINVLPSLEIANLEGVESLMQYPHGCMEQTVASTLPNLVVYEYLEASEQLTESYRSQLVNNMQSGFERIMGYRNSDGGFSYWGKESTPFYTALALSTIGRMKEHLTGIPDDLFERGLMYLEQTKKDRHWSSLGSGHGLMTPRKMSSHGITAFVIHALAQVGKPVMDAFDWMIENKKDYMDDPTVLSLMIESWALVDAYKEKYFIKDEIKKIKDCIINLAKHDEKLNYWERGSSLTSEVESTARVLIALSTTFPNDASLYKIFQESIDYLLSRRGTRGWGSTSDTLFATLAISKVAKSGKTNFTLRVVVNGKEIRKEVVNEDNLTWKIHDLREIYIDNLVKGKNSIEILLEGEGKCHVVGELKKYYHEKQLGKNDVVIEIPDKIEGSIGDEIPITINVNSTKSLESVMIKFPIPSVLKFDKKDLLKMEEECDHVELTDGSVCVFFEELEGRKSIQVPFKSAFTGTCKSGGNLFEMYSELNVELPRIDVTVH